MSVNALAFESPYIRDRRKQNQESRIQALSKVTAGAGRALSPAGPNLSLQQGLPAALQPNFGMGRPALGPQQPQARPSLGLIAPRGWQVSLEPAGRALRLNRFPHRRAGRDPIPYQAA